MSKIVQLVGHIARLAKGFKGEEREVTVDVDSWNLRLHDGVTPGGHTIPNLRQIQDGFQKHSEGLDALADLDATAKGIAIRRGPTSWSFRKIVGTTGSITILNGDGVSGHPQVDLAEVIEGSRTFRGAVTFESPITGTGGFNGNLTGNSTGLHTGDVIGDLRGNTEGNHTGGLDARGAELWLDDNQIPMSAIAGLAEALAAGASVIKPGFIGIWFGTVETIPEGWALCDGNNGTPNWIGKFPRAALPATQHTTGGSSQHQHAITIEAVLGHLHNITVSNTALTLAQMPKHSHGNGVTDAGTSLFNHGNIAAVPTSSDSIDNNSATGTREGITTEVGNSEAHGHTAASESAGGHTHTAELDDAEHLPPYIDVLFIIKV